MGLTAVGVLRERDETTLVFSVSHGESFHPESHLVFNWCLAGVVRKNVTSCEKLKLGDKSLQVHLMMQ